MATFPGSPADLETGIPAPSPHECQTIFIGDALIGQTPCNIPTQRHPDGRAPRGSGGSIVADAPGDSEVAAPRYFDHFEASATGHSWTNSYLLALTSDYVYRCALCEDGSEDSDHWFEQTYLAWGLDRVDFVDVTTLLSDTQAVVMSNDDAVIVVFRGTEQALNDFMTDGIFAMVPVPVWSGGLFAPVPHVHFGFYNAQFQAYSQVKTLINSHMGPGKTLWLAGHSLGAALATLVAYNLEKVDGVQVRGVYTYGSPRIGNFDWGSAYDNMLFGWSLSNPAGAFPHLTLGAKTHRWVNNADFIPTLPLASMGYWHVGTKHNIYPDGTIGINDPGPIILLASYFDHYGYPGKIYDQLPQTIKTNMPPPN